MPRSPKCHFSPAQKIILIMEIKHIQVSAYLCLKMIAFWALAELIIQQKVGKQNLLPSLQNYCILMKIRQGSRSSKKHHKSKQKAELTQHYLKEILKNIENIQSVILHKLENTSDREKIPATPSTPKKQSTPKSYSSNRAKEGYQSERCHTSREEIKTPRNIKPFQHRTNTFLTINPSEMKEEVLKQLNKTPITNHPKKISIISEIKQKQYKWSENNNQPSQFASTREKSIKDKQNCYSSLVKTQRECKNSARHHLSRQKYDVQLIVHQPYPVINPETNAQLFYNKEIQRLQLQERIRQLQEELQDCLYNKRASKPADFTFIRSKMKRISLELNQLKDQKQALKH